MQICKKIITKRFVSKKQKDAYLDACRWLGKNVYSKDEFAKNFFVKVEKLKDSKFPTFEVTLYFQIDENEKKTEHCMKCKRVHSTFYSSDGVRCDKCEFLGFHRNLEKEVDAKTEFYKEAFRKNEQEEDD